MNYLNYLLGLIVLLGLNVAALKAQNGIVRGKVVSESNGTKSALVGANVFWANTSIGTVTDENGNFSLKPISESKVLVASFVGYKSDSVEVSGVKDKVLFTLSASAELEEVEIVKRQNSTRISRMDALKTEMIDEKELLKAACCNLSESFETSPSIDVSFTDAVTGTRQIELLGLAGPYTQITRENIPNVRGLNAVGGLEYIPGTWMESIQLNKGAGSVVNGYESMVGQINYELRKPLDSDPLYVNLYANQGGRMEANIHATTAVSKRLATAVLLHAKDNQVEQDRNKDNFYDMPLSRNFIGLNRWFLRGNNGWRFQWGGKLVDINTLGGQIADKTEGGVLPWEVNADIFRYELFAKAGKVYDVPWKSLGLQAQYSNHEQENLFVDRSYTGKQQSLYLNGIYHSIIGNTNTQFSTGLSLQSDILDETINQDVVDPRPGVVIDYAFTRNEVVPGAFFELNQTWSEKFKTVAGFRLDHHNNYGFFATPRLHLWYAASKNTVIRASAGRGLRTASVIAENFAQLASTRTYVISGNAQGNPYGLNPEIAWNYGANVTQNMLLWGRDLQIALDLYRTDFENQVIVDRDSFTNTVLFSNLNGKSYANSAQLQVDYELKTRLDLRLAYRWYDVKATYGDQLLQKPFQSNHRAFVNMAYETKNRWFFDATLNWQGEQRLPAGMNETAGVSTYSSSFFTLNSQIRKVWKSNVEIYGGVENLLNYRLDNPIYINPRNDGSSLQDIDAASVWGPIFGRNIYLGFRYKFG